MKVLLSWVLLLAACGAEGSPPELLELSLSDGEVARGQPFYATGFVRDVDRDLDHGKARVRARRVLGEALELDEQEVDLQDAPRGGERFELIVGLYLTGEETVGTFELELVVEDAAGHASAPRTAPLLLRDP